MSTTHIPQPAAAPMFIGKLLPQRSVTNVHFLNRAEPHCTYSANDIDEMVRDCFGKIEERTNFIFKFPATSNPSKENIRILYEIVDGMPSRSPQNEPTMRLWFGKDSAKESMKAVMFHEIFHALGSGHEHQSPAAPFSFRSANHPAFDHVELSPEQVEANITRRYLESEVTYRPVYDWRSITNYQILGDMTDDGRGHIWDRAVGTSLASYEPSTEDWASLEEHYPKGGYPQALSCPLPTLDFDENEMNECSILERSISECFILVMLLEDELCKCTEAEPREELEGLQRCGCCGPSMEI
ncbi:hypothetical protein N0V90_006471 [Kalmusia sp. IMI 367209]|nr:hypothetical protein N0V90_006471 [Kalmusia sp. IMI 367209]